MSEEVQVPQLKTTMNCFVLFAAVQLGLGLFCPSAGQFSFSNFSIA